ncbi:acyl-CoA dehydrogenase [Mucilaginibacter daejeonensis]|uniref:acyl-CoA dehydrogenase n=1 Tax=Mucilaginibacter daejeonensis TaxID=398049 RepID=UPI001D176781|nr:acyl-CoA dehydrogenase [Mucilaginibacter daejeonensis]UEG53407.1 acyl-CoA dehydrogenase [Mucilaginibacter daejeonensis]
MTNNVSHPSALLKPEWVSMIRQHAFAAEQAGLLMPEQLELIYEQKWFKLLVPQEYGGLQMPLNDLVRLEEALSWADGSFGWTVTLCTGAGWFGGFTDPGASRRIFADPKVCLAGSGASTGTAEVTDGGYLLNGHWRYASGVRHATHFTANCIIQQDGQNRTNADGSPLILPFVVNSDQATQMSAWKYIGMMGTGSHAFTMGNAFAPTDRCFKIDPAAAVINDPLYRYPFMQLAEATLAANLSGMAIHFMDLAQPILDKKVVESRRMTPQHGEEMMRIYTELKEELQHLRQLFYEAFDASWEAGLLDIYTTDTLTPVSITSRKLARASREIVDKLYPYCGLQAASPDTEINLAWRDLHTASQHALLTFDV